MDWDRGSYEDTAKELEPAAEHVIEKAGIEPGHDVLDLGTGTGNAALLAARAGATVTAVDPSPRLLDVAKARVGEGTFEVARGEALPFGPASFDRVLSLFAVIFTEQPQQAATEILRVLKPQGRALITAWETAGGLNDALMILGGAAAKASGNERRRFRWGDPATVTPLFDGATVEVERTTLPFAARSAEEYLQRFESRHPAGMQFREALTAAGTYDEVRQEAKAALDANLPERIGYLVYTVSSPGSVA